MTTRTPGTLIAGGGLAGAAAACLLGPDATLVERETGPHDKVCGEFVSWEAQDSLRSLGLDPASFGAAEIDAVRLVHGRTLATAALPRRGLGLSRRVLDEALLRLAADRGATILRGHAIRAVTCHGIEVAGLGRLDAPRTLLATGKHDLRQARRRAAPGSLVALKMFFRLTQDEQAALARHVEIILFDGGYAGLQPVEHGLANLCLLITQKKFEAVGASWAGVRDHLDRTTPHLAQRLAAATEQLARPVAIARIPYGFVHAPTPDDPPNLLRLGDQMAVIPSFAGDGMAIALHTARHAAHAPHAQAYHRRMRAQLRPQIARAMTLHHLGQTHPGLVARAARTWPGALTWIARLTRVSSDDHD